MAQADGPDVGVTLHITGQHGHGVGVVQEQSVGAPALHVVGVAFHHRDGAQGAENAADAQGVGDGLAQAVLFGDLKVRDGAGLVPAHLDGVDHEIRPFESGFPVQGPGDVGFSVGGGIDVAEDLVRFFQSLGINVKEADVEFP